MDLTSPFKKLRGLPQGDVISPLLWSIFYEPLLTFLQIHSKGIKMSSSNVQISALAYADDLHPLAMSPSDLQNQLNIIHSFLSFHDMELQPTKCQIVVNQNKNSRTAKQKLKSLEIILLLMEHLQRLKNISHNFVRLLFKIYNANLSQANYQFIL